MIEDTKMRESFMAYFYCLIHTDYKDKYTISYKEAFNKTELAVYDVYLQKFNNEQMIDRVTLAFDMQLANQSDKFNLIIYTGDKHKWNVDHINEYFNSLLKEYRISLFLNAKNEKQIHEAIATLEHLNETTDMVFYDMEYALTSLLDSKGINPLRTDLNVFDNKIMLCGGLVGIIGKSGAGKTSLLVELMKRILVNETIDKKRKVSVLWNNMEDNIKMTIASMISQEVKVPAKKLRMRQFSKATEEKIKELYSVFKMLDIQFQDKQMYIHEIKNEWKSFLKKKKKQGTTYPILIIDNLMKLLDNGDKKGGQTEADDFIMQQISVCWNEAKKLYGDECMVIYLHHLGKEQISKLNAKDCYKPNSSHIKGSTRIQDVSTTLIFVHRFNDFDDIRRDFAKMSDILPYITLISCVKNREGGYIGDDLIFMDMEYKYCWDFPELETKKE